MMGMAEGAEATRVTNPVTNSQSSIPRIADWVLGTRNCWMGNGVIHVTGSHSCGVNATPLTHFQSHP